MECNYLTNDEVLDLIKKNFPDFFESKPWKYESKDYVEDPHNFSIGIKIAAFSIYTVESYSCETLEYIKKIFDFVEDMILRSNEDVSDAFKGHFLEYVINHVPDVIPLKTFVELLGPESKAYCKAWNDFCGIQMEGI